MVAIWQLLIMVLNAQHSRCWAVKDKFLLTEKMGHLLCVQILHIYDTNSLLCIHLAALVNNMYKKMSKRIFESCNLSNSHACRTMSERNPSASSGGGLWVCAYPAASHLQVTGMPASRSIYTLLCAISKAPTDKPGNWKKRFRLCDRCSEKICINTSKISIQRADPTTPLSLCWVVTSKLEAVSVDGFHHCA